MGRVRGQQLGHRWVDAHRSHPRHGVAFPPPLAAAGAGAGPAGLAAGPVSAAPAHGGPPAAVPPAGAWDLRTLARQVSRLQGGDPAVREAW
eukprot:5455220-Alexandrium_andersonii.AAC.1